MAWIMDEYSKIHGYTLPVVTGKPVEVGGSLGREQATGRGALYVLQEAAKDMSLDLAKARITVQGFGNVGRGSAGWPMSQARKSWRWPTFGARYTTALD